MSKAGKLVKDMVKAKRESVMGKLANGDDPMEPWSKRFDAPIKEEELNEDSWLYRYIRSLGWDPQHMTFAQHAKYARSNAFKHWKQSHMDRRPGETATMEEVEELDEAGTGLLMSYIKSKGLDPRMMDGNQKSAYSKSSEFRIFKNRHVKEVSGMGERGDDWNEEKKAVKEAVDEKDTVTMDIPLLIRVLEYAREDAKTDMDLHKVVENLINMRGDGALSMEMYDKIVAIKGVKEEYGPAATAAVQQRKAPYHVAAMDRKDQENKLNIDRSRTSDAQKVSRGEDPTLTTAGNAALKAKQKLNSEEIEKIDELSVNKMLKYSDAAEKDRKKLNAKWDAGTASRKEQEKAVGREEGENRATNKIKKKTGKYPWQLNREEIVAEADKNPHTSKLGQALYRDLSKEKKASPQQVQRNKERWAKRQAEREQGDKIVAEVSYINGVKQDPDSKVWKLSHLSHADAVAKHGKENVRHVDAINRSGDKTGRKHVEILSRLGEETEQIDEMKKQNDNMEIDDRITREEKKMKGANPCWRGYQMVGTKKKGGREVPNCVPEEKELKEGIYGIENSPLSATNSVKAMESTSRKKQMTKSARMIKSIYKKKNVKETMYDWEKSQKGGKVTDEPTAKIIMKGGTTMTGKPRDTIEIEPVLRTKLNRPASTNPSAQ